MPISPRNRAIVWGCVVVAALANIAGYLWNLYERISWFDEVLHAFTSFALTLPLALSLYGMVLSGAGSHPILFILTAASLGVAVGVLWEIAEWGYDQMVAGNVIKGKTDTMLDLIVDALGSVVAGIVSVGMVNAKR